LLTVYPCVKGLLTVYSYVKCLHIVYSVSTLITHSLLICHIFLKSLLTVCSVVTFVDIKCVESLASLPADSSCMVEQDCCGL
jgi:hypothetical protein